MATTSPPTARSPATEARDLAAQLDWRLRAAMDEAATTDQRNAYEKALRLLKGLRKIIDR